jgi:hypothetical protein
MVMVGLLGMMCIICLFGQENFIQTKSSSLNKWKRKRWKKHNLIKGEHENSSPLIFIID